MRHPLGSNWRVHDELRIATRSEMPNTAVKNDTRVMRHGLRTHGRWPVCLLSAIFPSSSPVSLSGEFVTRIAVVCACASASFSEKPVREPFLEWAGFQLMLLLWRRILANECLLLVFWGFSCLSDCRSRGTVCPTLRNPLGIVCWPSVPAEQVSTDASMLSSDEPDDDERLSMCQEAGAPTEQAMGGRTWSKPHRTVSELFCRRLQPCLKSVATSDAYTDHEDVCCTWKESRRPVIIVQQYQADGRSRSRFAQPFTGSGFEGVPIPLGKEGEVQGPELAVMGLRKRQWKRMWAPDRTKHRSSSGLLGGA